MLKVAFTVKWYNKLYIYIYCKPVIFFFKKDSDRRSHCEIQKWAAGETGSRMRCQHGGFRWYSSTNHWLLYEGRHSGKVLLLAFSLFFFFFVESPPFDQIHWFFLVILHWLYWREDFFRRINAKVQTFVNGSRSW